MVNKVVTLLLLLINKKLSTILETLGKRVEDSSVEKLKESKDSGCELVVSCIEAPPLTLTPPT